MHRRALNIREGQIFLGSPGVCVCALFSGLENLDLQEIAVRSPYLGVFASTHNLNLDCMKLIKVKACLNAVKNKPVLQHEIRIVCLLSLLKQSKCHFSCQSAVSLHSMAAVLVGASCIFNDVFSQL